MEKSIRLHSIVLLDFVVVLLFYMVPTLSHLTSIPLYKFEPMRCALLLNLLLTGNKKNAYIMAITLPLFSFLVGGHPFFLKTLLMALELSINVLLFFYLLRRINNSALSILLAVVLSKVAYYILKIGLIKMGFFVSPLFTTSPLIQLLLVVIIALTFWFYQDKFIANPSKE